MPFKFELMDEAYAQAIANWHYEGSMRSTTWTRTPKTWKNC